MATKFSFVSKKYTSHQSWTLKVNKNEIKKFTITYWNSRNILSYERVYRRWNDLTLAKYDVIQDYIHSRHNKITRKLRGH